jgi:hypothetical protein
VAIRGGRWRFREGGRNSYFSAANRNYIYYISGPKKNLRASERGRVLKSGIRLIVRTSNSPQHILRVGNRLKEANSRAGPGARPPESRCLGPHGLLHKPPKR